MITDIRAKAFQVRKSDHSKQKKSICGGKYRYWIRRRSFKNQFNISGDETEFCNYEIKIQFIFLMEATVIENNFFFSELNPRVNMKYLIVWLENEGKKILPTT